MAHLTFGELCEALSLALDLGISVPDAVRLYTQALACAVEVLG